MSIKLEEGPAGGAELVALLLKWKERQEPPRRNAKTELFIQIYIYSYVYILVLKNKTNEVFPLKIKM